MRPTIYICRDCPACERVAIYVKLHNVDCEVVNISEGGKKAPRVSIFPALYEDDMLKAYGNDILDRI